MSGHNSIKKCVACGERRSEIEFIKLVKNKDQVIIDPVDDLPGRKVYICPNKICVNQAEENNLLSKALKTDVSEEFYKEIMEEIGNE